MTNHYQEDEAHSYLKQWKRVNIDRKLYLYFQGKLDVEQKSPLKEFILTFDNKVSLKFELPQQSDIFFIDSSLLEDKLNEDDVTYDKQINNECLTEFAFQILLKESFFKLIKFCHQYDTKFNRNKFLSQLNAYGFKDTYDSKEFDLKKYLIFLFAQSINKEQPMINPRIKIYDIFMNLSKEDKQKIVQTSQQLYYCKDWQAIQQLIEEVFQKDADFNQSKHYFFFKNVFRLTKSIKSILENKIQSELQPNLNEIFNQQFMIDSGLTPNDYYDLFKRQTMQIKSENALKYIEQNVQLINFICFLAENNDRNEFQTIKKTLYSIVSNYFKDKDLVQTQKLLNSKKQLLEQINLQTNKVLDYLYMKDKLLQIKLDNINPQDLPIFEQIINNNRNSVDELFNILQNIKVLDFDDNSTLNYVFKKITSKILEQLNQITSQKDKYQKIEKLQQIVYKIFISNWSNLGNKQKIKQSINFEVFRYDFYRQYKLNLLEEGQTLFSHYLQLSDIIQNIIEISNQIQNQVEFSNEKKQKLKEKTFEELFKKLLRIEDVQELQNVLKTLNQQDIKEKMFENHKQVLINYLQQVCENLIRNKKLKSLQDWNISFILTEQLFKLFFEVFINQEEFKQSFIYDHIYKLFQKNINLEKTTWKDFKTINEEIERFTFYLEFFSLQKNNHFNEFDSFYKSYKQLKYFIELMKKLNATDIDDKKQVLDSIDQDENQEVALIQEKFQKIVEKNKKLIGNSQYLVNLKLFDQISSTQLEKEQNVETTMEQINTIAIPYLKVIYQFLLDQEFPQQKSRFQEKFLEDIKEDCYQDIHFQNCYKFLQKYFKNHFNLSKEVLQQEYENLNNICQQEFERDLSSKFFINFIQLGYSRIMDFELLGEIKKVASNFEKNLPDEYIKLFNGFEQIISQDNLHYQQFFQSSEKLSQDINIYLNEIAQRTKYLEVDRKFLKEQVIPFTSSILSVLDLHSNFKNEVDYQELLLDDDNDLANRVQHYILIKQTLEGFSSKNSKNILLYIQEIIVFFYKDEKSKEIRQMIEDISKFKDYIKQKFIDLKVTPAQNSVKILQMFIQQSKVNIKVSPTYLEKNNSQKEKKPEEQINNKQIQLEDGANYFVIYKIYKQVNNNQKIEEYSQEEIFSVIQRLNIISDQQLNEAYQNEKEEELIKQNRQRLEEFYDLIQKKLIQTLEKFIQHGYLDGFVKEIEISIDNKKSALDQVIINIQKIVRDKENQLEEWKNLVKETQEQYQFLKLISPICYPDLLRYFYKLLNKNVNQDYKAKNRNSITIQDQQFGKSNSYVQFNIEEMIGFYHMKTENLAKNLSKNLNKIKTDTLNEKIQLIGQYLNQQFEEEQNILTFSKNKRSNTYDKLVAKKIQCNSYGDMCKQLLNYFGNISHDRVQFFFANQETNEMDIEAFFNRIIYFEMKNEYQRFFFIVDFKKLKYQVQKYATELIDKYMNTGLEQEKTKNELILLYLYNQSITYSQDEDDETLEDCIRIPIADDYKNKIPQYYNENVHLFQSDIAGVGKTFQIQKLIEKDNQLLVNIPAHQFQNIDNLLKILRSKKKEIDKQQPKKIQGIHIEVIYDQQDKISLLLFQIIVVKCISFNQNKFFNFDPLSFFYIEKSNYYNIPYANILDHIKLIKKYQIQFNIKDLSISKDLNSDDQIMIKYLNGLQQDPSYFMQGDFVRFEAFSNQTMQKLQQFSDQKAQNLIKYFFDQYKLNQQIQQQTNFQSIVMFKQQFVSQIKEMEKDPNYTSYQINELLKNTSPLQQSNLRELRYNIISLFLEQSLKNTFLNPEDKNRYSKDYYQNYIKEVFQNINKNPNLRKKGANQSYLRYQQSKNQKKNYDEFQDTQYTSLQSKIIQNQKNKCSLLKCLHHIFYCFTNSSQKNNNQIISLQIQNQQNSEIKYLMKQNENYNMNENAYTQTVILNSLAPLSPEEERIRQKNTISQYDQQIKNLLFFVNGGIIASIFKDDSYDQKINKLKDLMRTFLEKFNSISYKKIDIDQELNYRIPHIGSTEDEYTLVRTLVYICSNKIYELINDETKQQEQKLKDILQDRAFTKDSTCKLIQIAFKIYSGVPLIVMGETGIGKTVNIEILSKIMGFQFRILRLSAGTTIDEIVQFIKKIKKQLNANSKIVIFFDEINTNQNIYGLLKEIFVEKSMNGKKISKPNQNIICIAACNPYEYITKKNKNDFEAGLLTRYQKERANKAVLTYHVYPLPESMLPFVVNYGQLEQKVEEKFISQMLNKINYRNNYNNLSQKNQKELNLTLNIFSQSELDCIKQMIMTSQQFIRFQQNTSRSVSLRDVSRAIKFIEFFTKSYFLKRGDKDTQTQKQKSVILSLYLCYQIRLCSEKQRDDYQLMIQHILSQSNFFSKRNSSNFFNETVNEELNFFINQLKIDSNLISKNRALKENCFCIATCILTKTPLFITGEPGTSKTLSFTIVINSFKGLCSSQFLQGFDSIKEFYIQNLINNKGNLQTKSEEIRKAFQQARNVKIQGVLPVVFFDEAGQAELSENNPNKVLHELLDDGDVSFIASSNYSLDYAKQNRCLHLQRNKNSLDDLKEFVEQLVKQNNNLKGVLLEFCQVYFKFHDQSKNYIHNSRDFYFTIKYCCSKFNKNPLNFKEEKDIVNLLYSAMIKNFSGYDENTKQIRQFFLEKFSKYRESIEQQTLDMIKIIEECFMPICEEFVYHSRFPMLITDNTDQGIEFAKILLQKNGQKSIVKAGSHFKKDFQEDKTREIGSINANIEQNISIISVNQDYIYAVYYDFFTMNFSRIGNKQKFRLNYKQIQNRIEVPQNYLFIMIVTKDQYMKMDLALLNRFEKHIFSSKLIFSEIEKSVLKSIINEQINYFIFLLNQSFTQNNRFKIIKSPLSKHKHFLSYVKKSYISGMVQTEYKKEKIGQNLREKCLDLIGNLSKKYDIVRLRKQNQPYFQAWNQKNYLDNLIEFVKYQKDRFLNNKQKGFNSIIYTHSYLYSNYEDLLKEKGFKSFLVDLNLIKQKAEFQFQIDKFFEGEYNLLIVKISSEEENPQNIYYIRSYLDEQNINQKENFQKSMIMLIQNSDSSHYRLPFCYEWEQYQIDNLLPYAYTQSSLQKSSVVQEINNLLNYRNIHSKTERQILENKKIFSYFTQMPGFSSKLIQRITFRFQPESEEFYQYYEHMRVILKDIFEVKSNSDDNNIYDQFVCNNFYDYFVEQLKQSSDQDDQWSYNYDQIRGQNYEKQMINYLKKKVESIILTLFAQYEEKNLFSNFQKIKKLKTFPDLQQIYFDIFQNYLKQSIVSSNSSEIKRIPHFQIKSIFSNIIFTKIENSKDVYETQDIQIFENHISLELKMFSNILNKSNISNYLEDFLFYKDIQRSLSNEKDNNYALFCEILQTELESKQYLTQYYHIHVIFWNHEKIFYEILELINIFQDKTVVTQLAKYLVELQVFQNRNNIIENVSNYYYQTLQKFEKKININFIDHFIKIFPSQALRYQIISQSYKAYQQFDKSINLNVKLLIQSVFKFLIQNYQNLKDLLNIFQEIQSEQISQKLENIYYKRASLTKLYITTFGILKNNNVSIDICFESLMNQIILFFNQNDLNEYILVDINLTVSYFLNEVNEEIKNQFLSNFNVILQNSIQNLILQKNYLEKIDKIFQLSKVKTEDKFSQLLIRIGEIIFQKADVLYQLNPKLIIDNFKKYEKQGDFATVQFIFTSIYFRIIAKEISGIIKEGFEKDIIISQKIDQNQLSQFLIKLSEDQPQQQQLKQQYIILYLLKLIYNENLDFFKKMIACKEQKRQEFLFIMQFKKTYEQNNFDPYEFPWCQDDFMNKMKTQQNDKQNFLVLSTQKMKKQEVDENNYYPQQIFIYKKIETLCKQQQSSLAKFITYLTSKLLDEEKKPKELKAIIQPNSATYLSNIYVPFNSLSQAQIQAIEIQKILALVQDKTKIYQCQCGFVYVVGNCGKNVIKVNCKKCGKSIGGQSHQNINQEYQVQTNIQQNKGINLEFIEDKFVSPREIDPLAFRFGNLIIFSLIFISQDSKIIDGKICTEIIIKQWKIIKDFLKVSDEYQLIVSLQLIDEFMNLNQNSFSDLNNRNQFEKQFSDICQNFIGKIEQIKQKFDTKNSKLKNCQQELVLLREQDQNALFLNTLQYYQIPQQRELEGQYLQRDYQYRYIIQSKYTISKIKLAYPLIYFYKKIYQLFNNRITKKFSEQQTLSKILESKPYLLKYYDENVKPSWNEVYFFLSNSFVQIFYYFKKSFVDLFLFLRLDATFNPHNNQTFLITEKEDNTKASQSDQLKYFIENIIEIQNNILKKTQKQQRYLKKDIFDLHYDDLIEVSQNLNLENLIYFENLQLEVNQKKKSMNTELLKNYYIFEQIENKSKIMNFQKSNFFQLKKDTSDLGVIYANSIISPYFDVQKEKLDQNQKEKFLKQCQHQEYKFEIREQLIYYHDLMKTIPKQTLQLYLKNDLYPELLQNGFIVDEPYFKESLRQFKVSNIFDLLVILETELMDELVQNLEPKFQTPLPDNSFEKFIKDFKDKVLDQLNKQLQKENLKQATNKDLQLVIGRYIIRNILPLKQNSQLLETNIFDFINLFSDQQYLDSFLLNKNDEVDFKDLKIEHKYIYNLYEKLAQDYKIQVDKEQKILQLQKQEQSKNKNNQQFKIFGQEMSKKQLHGNILINNLPSKQNNDHDSDEDEEDQDVI